MPRFARKLRRTNDRARVELVHELTRESLGFGLDEATTAEDFDVYEARSVEILELLSGELQPSWVAQREALEQRNGSGFIERVRSMGQPARAALQRAGLLAFMVLGLLVPSTAEARPESSHNVSKGKFSAFLRKLATGRRRRYHNTLRGGGRCGRWRSKSGGSELRSGSSRSSRTGYARAATSSRGRGPRSISFWSGVGVVSASGPFHTVTRTSRSNAPTARSSVRPGLSEFLPRAARLQRGKETPDV